MQLLNTLYVTLPDSHLRLDNDTLRLLVGDETRLRVPLHHLGAVVCFGHVGITAPLMHRLADAGIALVLLDGHGRFKARLEGATSGNVLLRRAQHQRADDTGFALDLARHIVAGKLRNQRHVLLRGARDAQDTQDAQSLVRTAKNLAASLRALPAAATLDEVRGIEGEAARGYFAAMNRLLRADLRADFGIDGRSRRPPRDRMNALLSFLYSMWMNDCRSAAEAAGLDPQVGWLHALRPGRAALALDLMEEFRHVIVDSVVLNLTNRNRICPDDFRPGPEGGVYLNERGMRTFFAAYASRLHTAVKHPGSNRILTYQKLFEVQAWQLRRVLEGEVERYEPFLTR